MKYRMIEEWGAIATLIIMVESEYSSKYRDKIDLNCMLEIDFKYTLYGGRR